MARKVVECTCCYSSFKFDDEKYHIVKMMKLRGVPTAKSKYRYLIMVRTIVHLIYYWNVRILILTTCTLLRLLHKSNISWLASTREKKKKKKKVIVHRIDTSSQSVGVKRQVKS